jgi:hypothetical protein
LENGRAPHIVFRFIALRPPLKIVRQVMIRRTVLLRFGNLQCRGGNQSRASSLKNSTACDSMILGYVFHKVSNPFL